MAELLFYQEPAFLNREVHKELKFTASTDYGFSSDVNSVPLTGIEFFEASRDMPVLFSKDKDGKYFPLALLSLMAQGHKQLRESGVWEDSYIPAFVRRYPFALTDEGTVCFDKDAKNFDQEKGEQLFDDKGENSETLNNIIQFLNNYDQQYKATRNYCDECSEKELFKPFNLQIMLDKDNPLRLEGLFILDEEKLNKLEDEVVTKWFRAVWLAWSYAHLHSLGALNRLVKKQQEAPVQSTEEQE